MILHDREVVVMFRGGSHVRNLNDEHSDDDLKYFVLPTREDLFTSSVYTKFAPTPELDLDVQDVRRLDNLFKKANPAYLDLLFSPEIRTFGFPQIDSLLAAKEDIARMNLPYLYSATMGMFNQNTKDLQNPTSDKVKAMIQDYGYNTKNFLMAVHFATFLKKFHQSRFMDYKIAAWYEKEERDYMLRIKHGLFSFEQAQQIIQYEETQLKKLEEDFKSQSFDDKTYKALQLTLRDLVFGSLEKGII